MCARWLTNRCRTGPVVSTATFWRVLAGIDDRRLAGLRQARTASRERAWAARGELTGTEAADSGGRPRSALRGLLRRFHAGHRALGQTGRGRDY